MRSLILVTTARALLPLLLLFSVFLLWRGHNEPGGGFIGGLVAAAAVTLHAAANGVAATRRALPFDPRRLLGVGLLVALVSGLAGVSMSPFLTGQWTELRLPAGGALKLGTPLLFDLGVYLVVLGMTLTIILVLAEDGDQWTS